MREQVENPDLVMEHDLAFHLEIAKASRNPIFSMIVGAFQGVSRQSWSLGWRSRTEDSQRLAMAQTHVDIADAIATGDPQKADALMTNHFNDSIKALLDAGMS
jgi:DNA-binding FadR family transcriptional regulator